jgi:1,2-diacylglycerol 3-alpha-glucosyltransferase
MVSEGDMKIGMMADLYKPHISGVTNYIAMNKRVLEAAGHEVFVFTFGGLDYKDDEANVIRSPGIPLVVKGYSFNVRYTRQARRLLQTMDVVHVHHPFVSGSLAMVYCKPKGIPIAFTNHTRYDLYAQAYIPALAGLGDLAMGGYLPAFCRAVDLVISPSAGMRDVLEKAGVDAPIDVVPNGINLELFRQPVEPFSRANFGFSDQDVLLVFVGRLGPEKNLAFLLRAFSAVLLAYPQVGLVLVGEGPDRGNLQTLVRQEGLNEQVFFTGLVPYGDIPAYLAMGDAFVTASVTEVHPFTVIEAMAAGLPVLGINSPGVGDTIQDGRNGFLCPKEDLAIFTAKLMRLVMDKDMRKVMGQTAREDSRQYAIERTMQMMLERYQMLAQRAAARRVKASSRAHRVKPKNQ